MSLFHEKARAKLGPGACTCWDCCRAVGLTPPFQVRHKHPRRYPHTVFNRHDDTKADGTECTGGDRGGNPLGRPTKDKTDKEMAAQTPEEQAHLRSAIRNREVI